VRLALLIVALAGCSPPEPDCVLRGNLRRRFVLESFTLPRDRTEHTVDLNDDGDPDNQLGNIVGFLVQAGIPAQQVVDDAIADGRFRPVLVSTTTDPSYRLAEGSGVEFASGLFCGTARNGLYGSDDGISEERPVEFFLALPFFDDAVMRITSGRILFSIQGTRISGRLNGAIAPDVLAAIAHPSVARRLTDEIRRDPRASFVMQTLSLFDNGGLDEGCMGGCRNSDGTCGTKMNRVIETCEVSTNSIVKNIGAPDVDLFDEELRYRPDRDNRGKDSVSMGVAFTAVEAQ
jgi:hypothetical protein